MHVVLLTDGGICLGRTRKPLVENFLMLWSLKWAVSAEEVDGDPEVSCLGASRHRCGTLHLPLI